MSGLQKNIKNLKTKNNGLYQSDRFHRFDLKN